MKKVLFLMSIALIACVSMAVISCSNEEIITQEKETEEFVRNLKFQSLSERLNELKLIKSKNTRNSLDINDESVEDMAENINLVIFRFKIARKSLDCKKGFGVCDFKWFPKENYAEEEESHEELSSILEVDDLGNKYMELRLGENVDNINMPNFIVDEDVIGSHCENTENELIIKQGHYIFDRNIGNFGGYRITIENDSI